MGTSDRGVIFPSGDAYYSEPFDLIRDLGMVSIIGLQDGDVAHVEIFIGDSCHGEWIPFSISCCGQMGINAPVNQMFLVVPNKYRLVFSNETGQHLTDPSWFENVKAFYKIVESDLDLSNLTKGDCDMVCRQTAGASSAQADFDGIKIGTHTSGDGAVTEFDIPVIKRNGESVPITIDPDTGKACINILDEDTNTDTDTAVVLVAKPASVANGEKTTCFDLVNYLTSNVITADYFCISSDIDTDTDTTIPDTFGTWNGSTITFPDGTVFTPTVNTDTFGTWDGTSITFPDGTSYVPQPDTSGTYDGTNIVFPDGTVFVPTIDTDTFGKVIRAPSAGTSSNGSAYTSGDSIVTFPDGTNWHSPLLVDCQGNSLTSQSRIPALDKGQGVFIRYIDSGDRCTPVKPDCTDIGWHTVNTAGQIMRWDVSDQAWRVSSNNFNPVTQYNISSISWSGTTAPQVGGSFQHTPNPCSRFIRVDANLKTRMLINRQARGDVKGTWTADAIINGVLRRAINQNLNGPLHAPSNTSTGDGQSFINEGTTSLVFPNPGSAFTMEAVYTVNSVTSDDVDISNVAGAWTAGSRATQSFVVTEYL